MNTEKKTTSTTNNISVVDLENLINEKFSAESTSEDLVGFLTSLATRLGTDAFAFTFCTDKLEYHKCPPDDLFTVANFPKGSERAHGM